MPDREAIEEEHRQLAWADPAKAAEVYGELLERVAVLTEDLRSEHECLVLTNLSLEKAEAKVAVLTEERDTLATAVLGFLDDWAKAQTYGLGSAAVCDLRRQARASLGGVPADE